MAGSAITEKNTGNDPWMAKLDERVKELHDSQHFCCSQTVLAIGMERLGIKDPDLLRAMEGFCGGSCAGVCGALAGGCALLGLYFGKGTASEPRSTAIHACADELCETFLAYWKSDRCADLKRDDKPGPGDICPALMAGTLEMVWDILRERSVDPDSRKSARKK
jgi:C_GCAxxG_C_C family probable redox protein